MAKPKVNRLGVAGNLAMAPVTTPVRVKPLEPTVGLEPTKFKKPNNPIETTVGTVGRPRRDEYKRLHITLSLDAAAYLESAWRTHQTAEGSFVDGPSGFIESLLKTHRSKG